MRHAPTSFLKWAPWLPALLAVWPAPALPAPLEAAMDWSGVADEVVARCGLTGLENLMVQELLAGGLAVVNRVGVEGFAVILRAENDVFHVEVAHRGESARRQVVMPSSCDSSIQLDLTHAMIEAIRELSAPSSAEPALQGAGEVLSSAWQLQLGAVGALPGTRHAAAGVSALGRHVLAKGPLLGVGFDATLSRYSGVLIAEPALFAQVLVTSPLGDALELRLGAEGAVLRHLYWADNSSGGRSDFRLGLPAELGGERWAVVVLPYLRRLRIRHIVGDEVAYKSEVWGIQLRVSMTIL